MPEEFLELFCHSSKFLTTAPRYSRQSLFGKALKLITYSFILASSVNLGAPPWRSFNCWEVMEFALVIFITKYSFRGTEGVRCDAQILQNLLLLLISFTIL
jgi:hypothetical protein